VGKLHELWPSTFDGGRFEWKRRRLQTGVKPPQACLRKPRKTCFSPSYLWMLRDILTFNARTVEDYAAGRLAGLSPRARISSVANSRHGC